MIPVGWMRSNKVDWVLFILERNGVAQVGYEVCISYNFCLMKIVQLQDLSQLILMIWATMSKRIAAAANMIFVQIH